jgi:uncharacterized protein YpuA (DUF1002 family)
MKYRIMALTMALCLTFSAGASVYAQSTDDTVQTAVDQAVSTSSTEDSSEESSGTQQSEVTEVLALGADLSETQKQTVLEAFGLDGSALSSMDVITVTNAEEHQYLDSYLDSSVIGTKALSSVYIVKEEEGHGLDITTSNINYCTVTMYKNALITAGLEDARVVVAGPTQISGTAALIGCAKAYSEMTGEEISEESLDAATDELVTTGEIGEAIGDSDDAAELIAYLKQYMIEHDLNDEDSISQEVKSKAEEMGYTLTDDEVSQITSLLMKISKLNIDVDALKEQAKDLFNALGFDSSSDTAKGIAGIFQSVVSFIKGLFNK